MTKKITILSLLNPAYWSFKVCLHIVLGVYCSYKHIKQRKPIKYQHDVVLGNPTQHAILWRLTGELKGLRWPWYHISLLLMLSDTHTYALYNDVQVQMHSQTVCTRRFLFTEEIRDRSQRQAWWEMRHNLTVFFSFFCIFTYSLAQEQAVGRCLNIAFMLYYTSLFNSRCG